MITDRSISVRVPDRFRLVRDLTWAGCQCAVRLQILECLCVLLTIVFHAVQELPLGLPVTQEPQSVKFVRKKAMLRVSSQSVH